MHNLRELDLSGQNLSSLPEALAVAEILEVLDLRRNHLASLPECIRHLPNLRVLLLAQNNFREFPIPVLNPNLERLDVSRNSLTSIPEEIGDLVSLVHLDLSHNEIRSLPETMRDLKSLHTLDVSCNRLTVLPYDARSLCDLVTATTYIDFAFYGNPLLPLPPEAFQLCEREDYDDLGWLGYYRALATLDHTALEAIIKEVVVDLAEAEQYIGSIRFRAALDRWVQSDGGPQGQSLGRAVDDPSSSLPLGVD